MNFGHLLNFKYICYNCMCKELVIHLRYHFFYQICALSPNLQVRVKHTLHSGFSTGMPNSVKSLLMVVVMATTIGLSLANRVRQRAEQTYPNLKVSPCNSCCVIKGTVVSNSHKTVSEIQAALRLQSLWYFGQQYLQTYTRKCRQH